MAFFTNYKNVVIFMEIEDSSKCTLPFRYFSPSSLLLNICSFKQPAKWLTD